MSIVHDALHWVQDSLRSLGTAVSVRFHEDPEIAGAFLRATVVVGTAFFLKWDETQVGASYLFIEALTAFIARRQRIASAVATEAPLEDPVVGK
jgi:hypothetical protein